QGLEKLPRYPGYFVTLVPSDNRRDNYRALKLEEITEEDIKEFKKKVKLFGVPYSEKLLAGY
ncbi:26477_t:CDS:1, partial [Racocetra persica]